MRTKDVDFVLVSSSARKDSENENNLERKRSIFEENLAAQGLQMEKETYGCLTFLKLHAPETVLKRYCEIMNFRMPIKKVGVEIFINVLIRSNKFAAYHGYLLQRHKSDYTIIFKVHIS